MVLFESSALVSLALLSISSVLRPFVPTFRPTIQIVALLYNSLYLYFRSFLGSAEFGPQADLVESFESPPITQALQLNFAIFTRSQPR